MAVFVHDWDQRQMSMHCRQRHLIRQLVTGMPAHPDTFSKYAEMQYPIADIEFSMNTGSLDFQIQEQLTELLGQRATEE